MDQTVYQAYGQPDEAQAATAAVLSALQQGSLSVLQLVGLLQRPLTDDTDHEARAKAVQLLSEVAAQAPEALKAGDVGVLADFLSSKLSDWRCVTPAVPGCLALLQRHKQPSLAPLPIADGVKLVAKVAAVHVQGFDYKGRLACYELLLEILQGPFAVPAALAGTDLVTFTLVAMENEADPRSLQVALQCVEAVGKLYQQVELSSVSHLHDNLEDLFDVGVVPYFPIIFPANMKDPQGITRDTLRERVIAAMACCPDFAALAIPVLSEKLGSSLKQAKEDALAALPVCMRSWGPAAVRPHLQAVWLMLKSELMAPAALDDSKQMEQLPAKCDMAAQAATALQHSTAALGPGLLDQQVLNDVAVEDLMQYLGLVDPPWANPTAAGGGDAGVGGGASSTGAGVAAGAASEQESWHLPAKAQRRLACIAACVAAVAAAGGECTAAACTAVLRPALAAVLQDTASLADAAVHTVSQGPQPARPLQANCGVLAVLHHTLKAVAGSTGGAAAAATAAAGEATGLGRYTALSVLMPDVVTALSRLQTQLAQLNQQQQQQEEADGEQGASSVSGLQISHYETRLQRQQLQLWLLLLWKDLLGLPVAISGLQQQQLTAAAQQLLQLALHGSSTDTELELSPGTTVAEQSTAAAALTLLAASSQGSAADQGELSLQGSVNMQALDSCADQLLQLLSGGGSSAAAVDLRQRAGSLLALLAGSSAAAAWQVLLWLKPVVLGHLQARTWDQLATILPILHNSCLPALPQDLPPQLSTEAAAFCVSVVEAWQQQDVWAAGAETEQQGTSPSSSSGHGQAHAAADAVLHSCLLCGQLAARCSLTDQRQLLLLPVCAWITQAAAAATAAAAGPSAAEPGASDSGMDVDAAAPPGPVCVALSVLAAARPGLLVARSTLDVATAAATLAVCAGSRGSRPSSSWLDSTAAAVSVGGILNKSLGLQSQQQKAAVAEGQSVAAVQPDDLLAAVLPVLTAPLQDWQQQQQQQQGHLGAVGAVGDRAACALRALSWTARGLAMQRHNGWQDIMQQYVLPVLLAAPGEQQPAADSNEDTLAGTAAAASPLQAPLTQLVWAAAEFFSVLVAASNAHHGPGSQHCSSSHVVALDASSLGHNLSLHCMARPLWQQKAFVLALEALTAAGAPPPPSPQPQPPSQQQLQAQGVWLAVGSLVSTAPAALTAAGQQQLLLLRCTVQLLSIWQALAPSSERPHMQADGGGVSIGGAVNGGLVAAGGSAGSSSGSGGVSAGMEGMRVLQLLHRCLLMLGDALSDSTQAVEQLGGHVELLLHTLCQLSCLQPGPALQQQEQQQRRELLQLAAAVREVAVMCVTSSMNLPYHLLHPHKRQVMAAVTAALDDDRRAVRKAAVLCRSTWSSS